MRSGRWARAGRILLLMSLGACPQGFSASSQATELDPSGGLAHAAHELRSLGPLCPAGEKDRYEKAVAELGAGRLEQAAQELRPLHSAVGRDALGVVLEIAGDRDAALVAFREALRLQPDFAEAAYNAAKLLIREGRPEAGISQLRATLEADGGSGRAVFALKILLAETESYVGRDKSAAEILEALLAEWPDSPQVRFDLAMTYARLGSLQAAATQFRDELRLKPGDSAALMELAKVLLNMKRGSDAEPYARQYLRLRPSDAQGYYVLGLALHDTGRLNDAAVALSHGVHLNPEDYDIRYHLGMVLWQTRRPEAAVAQFEAAARLKPNDIPVHSALARVLRSLGKEQLARKESESAERLSLLKNRDDQASYCIAAGNVHLDQGDLRGAAELFRQALELDPGSGGAHYDLGLALARSNDRQGAKREFQKAIALDPKLALAYNALGHIYLQEGQVSEAKAAYEQAIRINPQYAEAKNSFGTLYARLGKNAEAVALFKEATEDAPDYAEPFLNWGLVLANQGNLIGAKEMFEKALRLSPNLAEARKDLETVEETLKRRN